MDDGSTDNSWEVLNEFAAADSRVKIFKRHRAPKGACTCRNIAVENSTGDYLVFLDTDDLLAPWCLQQRIDAVKQDPGYDFLIFPMLLFRKKPDDMRVLWNVENGEDDLHRILVGDPICQGTGTIWKKNSFVKAGMWREDLHLWQDIELHIRALLEGYTYKKRLDLLPDIFLRISEVSLSRTSYNSLPKFQSRVLVLKYTVQTLHSQQRLAQYKPGLRYMAANLLSRAIECDYYEEADDVLRFCVAHDIFGDSERRFFTNYLKARKFRLMKIPLFKQLLGRRFKSLVPELKPQLGTVPYNEPVNLAR